MTEELYYYAGGERVPLELDPKHVAIDVTNIGSAALRKDVETLLDETERTGRSTQLRHELHLAEKKDLPKAMRGRLERAGALQPVFRHGKTLMIALPEVRVEVEKRRKGSSLAKMIDRNGPEVEIVRDQGTRLTLRPTTGSGLDALHLANGIHETIQPLMAQVRVVRVVPKP